MDIQRTTQQLVSDFIAFIKYDAKRKGFTENFNFDFQFTKEDLPFDFDKDNFIGFSKEAFVISRYNFDDFGYKFRFSGVILRIKGKTFEGTFTPSKEMIEQLQALPISKNF